MSKITQSPSKLNPNNLTAAMSHARLLLKSKVPEKKGGSLLAKVAVRRCQMLTVSDRITIPATPYLRGVFYNRAIVNVQATRDAVYFIRPRFLIVYAKTPAIVNTGAPLSQKTAFEPLQKVVYPSP